MTEAILVHCPMCAAELAPDHPGARGVLINAEARLGARVAELEDLVRRLGKTEAARFAQEALKQSVVERNRMRAELAALRP